MLALKPVASVALILLIFNVNYITAEYDVAQYCQLVPKKTKFPSFKNCQTFYTCQDSNTIEESKCPGTDVFDKDAQACIPRDQSDCLYGVINPCDGKNDTFSKDPKECRLWHYCLDGKSINSGFCNKGQYFNGEMCVNGPCPIENQNAADGQVTEVKNICNIMKLNEFFGDFDDCKKWKKCLKTDAEPKVGNCLNDLVYDVESRMCLAFKAELCTRTGGVVKPTPNEPTGICINGRYRGDEKICSIYYFCKDSAWEKKQCDNNKYFDTKTETCVDRKEATPVKTCDRCQYSTNQWVNAVDSNCTEYLTCKDGHRIGDTGSCGPGNYFNEKSQICLIGNTNLPGYRNETGACFCDGACEVENCGEDADCKGEINCEGNIDSKVKCEIAKCGNTAGCKETACEQYEDEREKIICRLDVCKDDETCKQRICEGAQNYEDFCEIQKCKNDKCKTDYCNKKSEPANKANCKTLLCPDENCKIKTCNEIADITKQSECKVKVCDGRSSVDDKVKCKLNHCSNNVCKKQTCEIYTDLKKRVTCKQGICQGDDDNAKKNCLIQACNDYGSNVQNRVQCKLNICGEDQNCKQNICSEHTETENGEQIQCKIAIADLNDENDCNQYPQHDDNYFFCKMFMCKDIKCKQDFCGSFYSNLEDEHEKLSCQLKSCEIDKTCITEFCTEHSDFDSCNL